MKEYQNEIYFFYETIISNMEISHFMDYYPNKYIGVLYFTKLIDNYMKIFLRNFYGNNFSSISK